MVNAKYLIVIDGEIDAGCAASFEPASVAVAAGRTEVATGPIDQSALHGLLARIAGLRLTLVSVTAQGPP